VVLRGCDAAKHGLVWRGVGGAWGGDCNLAANLKNFTSLVEAKLRCTITQNAGKLFCFPVCGIKKKKL